MYIYVPTTYPDPRNIHDRGNIFYALNKNSFRTSFKAFHIGIVLYYL